MRVHQVAVTLSLALGLAAVLVAPALAGTVRGRHQKQQEQPAEDAPATVLGSQDDAISSTGCPCPPGETDCGCGHVPRMVPPGHFAHLGYQLKVSQLNGGNATYRPTIMPRGYFNESARHELPKEMPEEKPNMVPPGHFAKVAAALRDAKLSKTFGTVETQKQGACKILDRVLGLGRFIYEAESSLEAGIGGAGKAIVSLVDVVCPLIAQRYPDASKCLPGCAAMKERITKLYDPKFIGEVKTPRQRCEGRPGRKVNFALIAALTGSNLLFGSDFCQDAYAEAPSCDKSGVEAEMRQRMEAQVEEENQAAEAADELEAETEQQVLRSENLSWERNQIRPLDDDDDDDGRGPVEPALPAKAIECDRDCKVRKQLEKEQAEAVQVPAADYDISNDENIHNAVNDAESSGLNQERGTEAASA